MKNLSSSRNKFMLCFRPVVHMETVLKSKDHVDCSATTSLATFFHLENEEIKSLCQDYCPCSRNSGCGSSVVSRQPKRTLSRAVKAVLFGTILIKRVREREGYHQQKPYPWKRSSSLKSERFPTKEDDESVKRGSVGMDEENKADRLAPVHSLSSGSSSSFPLSKSKSMNSSASVSTVAKMNKKTRRTTAVQRRNADRSRYAFSSGIGLLVISVATTVMKGRLLAIFLTSIWLYFFAWMHIEGCGLKKKTKFTETELKDKRKGGCQNLMGGSKKEKPEKAIINL